MGHQHDSKKEPVTLEVVEKGSHPFLEKNDVTYLSMIRPLLSANAQKLVAFFIDFDNTGIGAGIGTNNTSAPSLNLTDLMGQLSPGQKNSIADLAPSLLGMLSNNDSKGGIGGIGGAGGINPALLTTLLGMLNNSNNKKED